MTQQQPNEQDPATEPGLRLELTPEQREEVMGYIARTGADALSLELVFNPIEPLNVLAPSTFLIGTAE